MLPEMELTLPRHCFSPRQVARAGEIWRLCQEVAVRDSTRRGWPPERYLETRSAFVVSDMAVQHIDELRYGEAVCARTWVRDFRRGILSRREIRIFGPRGPVAQATQRWVHVDSDLKPTRACAELLHNFPSESHPEHVGEPPVGAPKIVEPYEAELAAGSARVLRFTCWQTWMDPLGHVNHPVYVDWCDEAISRVLVEVGLPASDLQSVGEQVKWRSGAVAGEPIAIATRFVGAGADGAAILRLQMTGEGDRPLASAVVARRLAGAAPGTLAAALSGLRAQR